MADSEKSERAPKNGSKSSSTSERKRFYTTQPIPRLSHTDPLANELISQEVSVQEFIFYWKKINLRHHFSLTPQGVHCPKHASHAPLLECYATFPRYEKSFVICKRHVLLMLFVAVALLQCRVVQLDWMRHRVLFSLSFTFRKKLKFEIYRFAFNQCNSIS